MSKPKSNESKDEKTDQATSIDQQLVVASSVQPHIKHPLQSRWTLWYYISEKGKTWEDCQHRITSFATVEDFWSLIHHLQPPSELKSGSDYSLFKNNIRPMWEDRQNIAGGRWIINVAKSRQSQNNQLDEIWIEILLLLIGESFDYTDEVCGAVLNNRAYGHKIGVWTAKKERDCVLGIGKKVKECLFMTQEPTISFESHVQTKQNAYLYGKASSQQLFTL